MFSGSTLQFNLLITPKTLNLLVTNRMDISLLETDAEKADLGSLLVER